MANQDKGTGKTPRYFDLKKARARKARKLARSQKQAEWRRKR